jgi:hypothetical protein
MQKISKQSTDLRKFSDDRSRWESSKAPPKSAQPNVTERKGPSTQPTERKESVTPSAERKQPITPPSEQHDKMPPSTERKAESPSHQENNATKSERVNIPSPPITGKREGFFSKTSPSQPADEHKTDVKHTPKSDGATRDKDASKDNDSSKGRGQQGGDRSR